MAANRYLFCIVMLLLCAGCGPRRFPVSGEVAFNGKPVQEGTISMEPADGQGPTTGGKIVAGRFQLTGEAAPFPGKKIVRISAGRKTGRKIPVGSFGRAGDMVDEMERYIPEMYNTRSTLTCEIIPGESKQINFDLKSPGATH
jgi:hypothetical protein